MLVQKVAQLVERPIEIVEYQRHSCQCAHCGQGTTAAWSDSIVPGQDLGVTGAGDMFTILPALRCAIAPVPMISSWTMGITL